jgi:[acyl-carrier-protein] S-malonyltransferase
MKKSVTLLFPGQGSQYVGMGQNLAPELAKLANENLGFDLQQLMLEGPIHSQRSLLIQLVFSISLNQY